MAVKIPRSLIDLFVEQWNRRVRRSYDKVSAGMINSGWCYQFALAVKKVWGERCQLWSNCHHAWVEIDDRFYDSNHPAGVDRYEELGRMAYQCFGCEDAYLEPGPVTEQTLIKYWSRYGATKPVRVDIAEEVALTFKQNNRVTS